MCQCKILNEVGVENHSNCVTLVRLVFVFVFFLGGGGAWNCSLCKEKGCVPEGDSRKKNSKQVHCAVEKSGFFQDRRSHVNVLRMVLSFPKQPRSHLDACLCDIWSHVWDGSFSQLASCLSLSAVIQNIVNSFRPNKALHKSFVSKPSKFPSVVGLSVSQLCTCSRACVCGFRDS